MEFYKFLVCYLLCFALAIVFHETFVSTELQVFASHRTKRSAGSFRIPQPTLEFPLVLFAGDNYNNGTEGVIHRSRPDEYRVWAQTIHGAIQKFVFQSLLVLPGWKLTFQACCASGNSWTSSVSNVEPCTSALCTNFTCPGPPGTCYFGSCGLDGTCQCKDGYSGDKCEKRPLNVDVYPSLAYPLLLFPQPSFQGTPVKVSPDTYHEFAENAGNARTFTYSSARVLFTRAVTFSRNEEDDQIYEISPGSDIGNLQSFFASNMDFGTPLWFNYARTIDSKFYIKVAGDSQCTGCSEIGGSCYTGQCVCLPGHNGTLCDGV